MMKNVIKKKTGILIILCLTSFGIKAQWSQIGFDIDGDSLGDQSGSAVSMSYDARVVAVGAVYHYCHYPYMGGGHVRVFGNVNNNWVQIGNDIESENYEDEFGYSVDLNSDGSIIAIGGRKNDSNGNWNSGHVRVYQNNSGNWVQLGNDIDGQNSFDEFGTSLSLNNNGTILAVGAPRASSGAGQVKVYEYVLGNWIQLGNTIYGIAVNDYAGQSVCLNSDGNILAVPSLGYDGSVYLSDKGHVRIFELVGGIWVQLGSDIQGSAGDKLGKSVSLNSNGTIVAISSQNGTSSGYVKTYKYLNNNWVQFGTTIYGTNYGNYFGNDVSLNYSGNIMAIGSSWYNKIKVFENRDGTWEQIYNDLNGEYGDNHFGYSVEIDSSGYYFVGGAPLNDAAGMDAGAARVYHNCSTKDSISITTCGTFTPPSGNPTYSNSGIYYDIIPNINGCDSIIRIDFTNNNTYSNIAPSVCDSLISPSNNYTWTNSGTYIDTVPNSFGCDSVITIDLSILSTHTDIYDTICDNNTYTSPAGHIYYYPGIYIDTLTNINGCDSIITTNLSQITSPFVNLGNDLTIAEDQDVIIGSGFYLPDYLWSTGDTTPCLTIVGENLGPGIFSYWLYSESANGCSDSDTINITIMHGTNIDKSEVFPQLKIFPNPANNILSIKGDKIDLVQIINRQGIVIKEITQHENINIEDLSEGVYILKIYSDKKILTRKLIKE